VVRDGEAQLACGRGRGRVAGVRLGGELIEGDAVVAATGAWTRSFLQAAGLAVPVQAQRGQIMHISLGEVDTSRWPVVLPGASGHYLLAFDDGRIVAGARRPGHRQPRAAASRSDVPACRYRRAESGRR
jgi:D-amino-acid dehydrogenase